MPSTTLSLEQEARRSITILQCATSPQDALKQAKKLTAAWPHANPPNPAGWAASLGAVLEQYPYGVVEECCDPRTGLARERDFPPTVKSVVDWCDKRLKYHRGMARYQPAPLEQQFTEEHERGMIERLKDLFSSVWAKEPSAEAAE